MNLVEILSVNTELVCRELVRGTLPHGLAVRWPVARRLEVRELAGLVLFDQGVVGNEVLRIVLFNKLRGTVSGLVGYKWGNCSQTYVFSDGTRLPQRQVGVGVDNGRHAAVGVDAGELDILDLVELNVL